MAPAAGPILALVHVPPDLLPAAELAFGRVWSGRVVRADRVEELPEAPLLAVVASRDTQAALREAAAVAQAAPDTPILLMIEGARLLRGQRGLPEHVAWALWTDELEPRVLGLVLRYALESGQRRRVERRLEASRPMADMGWVASAVSHEIGNPLTSLLTNLELARQQVSAAADRGEALDVEGLLATLQDSWDGARHIGRIAADLGRASRRSGRMTNVDVRSVLETARRLATEPLEGIEIRTRTRRVPAVRVDETRLTQVFLNLLKNAGQALEGRSDRRIDLDVEVDGEQVLIRVSDNGPGVAERVRKRLFEPWQTTRPQGSGLGLALCRKYLEEMGGTITLLEGGEGARFEIRLPGVTTALPPSPTLVPDRQAPRASILVVDDTALVRRAIQRALAPAHEVQVATGAEEALAQLAGRRFDLMFVDLHMPGLSGLQLYDEVVERYPDRVGKVVFLSGAFSQEDLSTLERNNLPWVRKPIGAEELRELVDELMSNRPAG